MELIFEYLKPELIVLAVALYFIGIALKKATVVKDKYIPLLLSAVGIVLALVYVLATSPLKSAQEVLLAIFVALVQGTLVAGLSTYVNQMIKQASKEE